MPGVFVVKQFCAILFQNPIWATIRTALGTFVLAEKFTGGFQQDIAWLFVSSSCGSSSDGIAVNKTPKSLHVVGRGQTPKYSCTVGVSK